ncbi:MAG: hypothetical protein HYS56_01140 [Candidatus Omnitrophica bacterium]|nr:hypothetical protein [Candidatus Omnitrophota bacterium]
MPITDSLKKLIELQKIDAQAFQLRAVQQKEIPGRLKACDDRLLEVKKRLTEAEEKLKVLQLEKKNKELDLQTKENNVKKFQLQLFQVKTNKEYSSLEKEIEGLKADNSLLEEEIIHLLDAMDSCVSTITGEKKIFDEESKIIQAEKEKAKQELEQTRQRLKELEEARRTLTQQIDPLILPRYERVLKLRNGMAMVLVKDGSCQGCFINLPPQVVNLVNGAQEWVVCEQCARILYVEDEING